MNGSPDDRDYTPAPRTVKGEPPKLVFDTSDVDYNSIEEMYADGLDTSRGWITGVIIGLALILLVYSIYALTGS